MAEPAENVKINTAPLGIEEGGNTLRRLILQLIMFHLGMAGVSLIVTGSISELKGVTFLLLPVALVLRTMTLSLFTFPACFTPYRRTFLLIMSALWMMWQGFSYGRYIETAVMTTIILAAALYAYFFRERREPAGRDAASEWFKRLSVLLYFSLLFIFMLEVLQTGSFLTPLESMLAHPDILACNLLYFTAIGSFVLWIRRPVLGAGIYLIFWVVFGIASLIKNTNTYEPVLLPDVFQIKEGLSAVMDILGIFWFILIIAAVIALVVGLVLLGLKAKKREKAGKKVVIASVVFMTLGIVTCVGASFLPWVDFTAVSSRELFSRNGYVFSFITTGYRTFRTKPSDYDQDKVGTIVATVDNAGKNSGDVNIGDMNIVVIQVESLIDPLELEGVEYERDPMPFLRSLRENYSYGKVTVPIFGGQTVKSEFEFLTGYSINNLPYGYNPYMIHLDDIAVDSFPRYLKTLGFETIGMHDYQGEFFSRNLVYKNLGFDRFVSYEFMAGAQKKELVIWSDDSILLEQMKMALDSSESGKHFIFAVTVQTHGAYPSLDKSEYPMEIRGLDDDPAIEGKLEYYVGQLEQVDNHIRNIVEYFEQRGEPTAIVIYSDHMPTFALDLPGITAENRFEVNFFSWNNMGLRKDENLQMNLYRLSTYLCDEIGLTGSFMNRFHRLYYGYDNYTEYFEKIQYYKLFEEPEMVTYTNENFELGLTDLRITEITYDAELDEYTIRGEGMTDDAYLCVNGRIYGLVYVDPHTVKYTQPKRKLSEEDTITLRIIGEKYGEVLKESDVYEWG